MLYKFEAALCTNEDEIVTISNYYQKDVKGDRIPEAKNRTYHEMWKEKYDSILPGVSKDNVIALAFLTYFKKGLPIAQRKWVKLNQEFFNEYCGAENVLSIIYREDEEFFYCSVFVFPLVGRQLSIDPWFEKKSIKLDFYDEFLLRIENEIGHFEDEEMKQQRELFEQRKGLYPELNAMDEYPVSLNSREEADDVEMIFDTIELERMIQTDMDIQDLLEIQNATLTYFTSGVDKHYFMQVQKNDGSVRPEQFMLKVDEYLQKYHPKVSANDREYIKSKVMSAVYGYYVLDNLIEDDNISDIKIMNYDKIRVKIGGSRYTSNLNFISPEDFDRFMNGVAMRNNLDLNYRPQVIFTDKTSSEKFIMRIDITTAMVNSVNNSYLHIRKVPKDKRSLEDLIRLNMMPRKIADYLVHKVKTSPGILFCGKGASGKTTILSTLLDYIPYDKSGVVVQESEELFSKVHPELEFQHVLLAEQSPTGKDIGLKELTKAALVSDEDYIIIGEVKGGECLYAINAAATGHQFMCTIHASNSQTAIDKMADYIKYESDYTKEDAEYMLKDIQVVVFMKNFKVEEISEVIGWDHKEKHLIYKTVYSRDPEAYVLKKEQGILQ